MTDQNAFSYTILRYIHDTTTGEFANVGVALHAPGHRYASAICRNTLGRLSKTFPGINAEHFKSLMRHIQARCEEIGQQLETELPLDPVLSVHDLVHRVLRPDDSSLQWSPIGVGRTENPAATLEQLFERMVMRHEEAGAKARRTENDVWRHFRRNLETRQLLRYLEPRKITVKDDQVEFEYTLQNGILHCLEPVSFDLSTPESIRDKAHRWLGCMASIAESNEDFRLYFLVGAPQEEELRSAYESALSILGKSSVDTRIFAEHEADKLSGMLADEVARHQVDAVAEPPPRER